VAQFDELYTLVCGQLAELQVFTKMWAKIYTLRSMEWNNNNNNNNKHEDIYSAVIMAEPWNAMGFPNSPDVHAVID